MVDLEKLLEELLKDADHWRLKDKPDAPVMIDGHAWWYVDDLSNFKAALFHDEELALAMTATWHATPVLLARIRALETALDEAVGTLTIANEAVAESGLLDIEEVSENDLQIARLLRVLKPDPVP